ncbi:hypothetical protein Q9L58_001918 [Maublancomyces gigas]|uniref:Uncharacterized protein n=1 Tax=Discina gigas TaxID=1032678 RepID=A0ABR3GSW2_9PEZI
MTTAENLHAAIGKGVQIINARAAPLATTCNAFPPITRALIISFQSSWWAEPCRGSNVPGLQSRNTAAPNVNDV